MKPSEVYAWTPITTTQFDWDIDPRDKYKNLVPENANG